VHLIFNTPRTALFGFFGRIELEGVILSLKFVSFF
jgi:hypothetical protein